jgi:hypothetical protein
MAKESFTEAEVADATTENPAAETPTDKAEVSKALVTGEAKAPAPYAPPAAYTSDDDAEGEFTESDRRYPRLNVVAKTSKLLEPDSETVIEGIKAGDLVLAQEIKLDAPLEVVVCQIQKKYQESLPWGSQQQPRLFDTAAEVHAAGFSTEWGAKNQVNSLMNIVLWIGQPTEGLAEHLFPFEGPLGLGTLAKFTVTKTGYTSVGIALANAKKSFCSPEKGGFVGHSWELYTTFEKKNGNSWWLPRIRPMGATDPKLAQYLRELKSAA